jgi:hypothetical protein
MNSEAQQKKLKTVRGAYTDQDLSIPAKKGPEKFRDTLPLIRQKYMRAHYTCIEGLWLVEGAADTRTFHREYNHLDNSRIYSYVSDPLSTIILQQKQAIGIIHGFNVQTESVL